MRERHEPRACHRGERLCRAIGARAADSATFGLCGSLVRTTMIKQSNSSLSCSLSCLIHPPELSTMYALRSSCHVSDTLSVSFLIECVHYHFPPSGCMVASHSLHSFIQTPDLCLLHCDKNASSRTILIGCVRARNKVAASSPPLCYTRAMLLYYSKVQRGFSAYLRDFHGVAFKDP
eukprot:6190845-Pleurochrysis_carterae.AAC.3